MVSLHTHGAKGKEANFDELCRELPSVNWPAGWGNLVIGNKEYTPDQLAIDTERSTPHQLEPVAAI